MKKKLWSNNDGVKDCNDNSINNNSFDEIGGFYPNKLNARIWDNDDPVTVFESIVRLYRP